MSKTNLKFEEKLLRHTSSALAKEAQCHRSPKVLYALVTILRLRVSQVCEYLSVSQPTISNWLAGRFPIPDSHHTCLVALLRSAIKVAETAIASAPVDIQDAIPAYRERVNQARQILETIDAEH